MKLINTFEVTQSDGTLQDWVQLERAEGEYTWMPKAEWDELEAAKENGTIS
jgi:hypothetical protein